MRIIAGQYGGRKLGVPKGRDIRPTSDKVRGSIFNALGSRIDIAGVRTLDLFCGTGALGIEALSRGASSCIFIDNSRESLDLARANAEILDDFFETEFIHGDASAIRARPKDVQAVDVFFCDPPYNMNLITPCLESLIKGQWIAKGAIGVLEAERSWPMQIPASLNVLTEKIYGDTKVIFVEY